MNKFLLTALSLILISSVSAENLDLKIDNGVFHTSEGMIPVGCFGQLMIELNGDDTIAAVYINRTTLRGCIASNFPYPGGEADSINYKIIQSLDNYTFKIEVCTVVGGSMGSSCSRIIIQFKNREYIMPEGIKQVLTVEKLGEW